MNDVLDSRNYMQRNLDGVFFRIKRGNKYTNVCFSDLTAEERKEILDKKCTQAEAITWLRSMCEILADTLRNIGDEFDIWSE